jgi:hypothetical protein
LGEQGILNISKFTYYPQALSAEKATSLVNGSLTTAFDTDYSATTNFAYMFSSNASAHPEIYGSRLKYFPKINTSSANSLYSTFSGCFATGYPLLNTPNVTSFAYLFSSSLLQVWPLLNTSSGTSFFNICNNCTGLTTVGANAFDNAKATNYTLAFTNCALTQTSVDNILVSVAKSVTNTPTLINGTLNMTGGTSATPSATGLAAKASLVAAGWTVTHN